MTSLEVFQQRFLRLVRSETVLPEHVDNKFDYPGLNVYQNNYRTTHLSVLNDTFRAVRSLVGDGYFRQLARAFITGSPSCSGDLNDYGEDFANFLQISLLNFPALDRLPYLPDIARVDWASHRALYSTEPGAMNNQACIALHSACTLVHSRFPVHAIWQIAHGQERHIELDAGAESVAVSRTPEGVQVTLLTEAEVLLLQQGTDQINLEWVLMRVIEQYPDTDIQALFERLNRLAIVGELRRSI